MQFAWDQAAPGITAAFRTLLSNPYARGAQDQVTAETALAKALWGIEQDKSQIGANDARASVDAAKAGILGARPGIVNELALLTARQGGFTGGQDSFNEGRQRISQGLPASVYDSGEQTMIDPKAETAITRALLQNLPLLGAETWNPDQIQNAASGYADDNRVADAAGKPEAIAQLQALEFARRGNARYGVQGDEMIDQLGGPNPFRGQTTQGQSKIQENKAQAGAAGVRAASEGWQRVEGIDPVTGQPAFEWVQTKGGPKGQAPSTKLRPMPRRDAEGQDARSEHSRDWPDQYAQGMPSVEEYRQIRAAGMSGKTPVLDAKPGAKSYEVGKVYRTPKGLMIRREGGWEPIGGATAQ